MIMETSGGGCGDPLARVALDVAEGGVSRAQAEARCAVVFRGHTVDEHATRPRARPQTPRASMWKLHPTDALALVTRSVLAPAGGRPTG